ncbi:putative tetR-family transcriptional regulator [Marinomonas sp. MED121]|uniref:TetR/AcrR family transcriptional regulator n=1 Tax=Marinomonas sp. MED121 TaxID=314277 RepID=UPI000069004E|nr:TetR/AcrR family transcriptional regulator [Marinomonas sp. MED121]EAQ65592.1 putative tetR-family transcriptional regulator [Marinomonas sp. MED121]
MERNSIDEKKRKLSGAALKQESVTLAIEKALFEEWVEKGYASISLESVAKRAGVGKAAIYRRWPSKFELVTELVNKTGADLIFIPDTGRLKEDIFQLLKQLRRVLRHRLIKRILPDLHAEMGRNSALAQAIRSKLQIQRRQSGEILIKRAIERKEISPDTNVEMILDLIGSMIYWRMIITKNRADSQYLHELTELILKVLKK